MDFNKHICFISNCTLLCGASVDFVDIDIEDYNLSVIDLKNKLLQAEKINKLPKGFNTSAFAGRPCKMRNLQIIKNMALK